MLKPFQESLQDILSVPVWERKAKMYNYALNLFERDIQHVLIQAENRSACSVELDNLLNELSEVISKYSK